MQLGGNSLESPRCSWALILETPQRASTGNAIREIKNKKYKKRTAAAAWGRRGVSFRIFAQLHLGEFQESTPNCILGILKNQRPTASWPGYHVLFHIIPYIIPYIISNILYIYIYISCNFNTLRPLIPRGSDYIYIYIFPFYNLRGGLTNLRVCLIFD